MTLEERLARIDKHVESEERKKQDAENKAVHDRDEKREQIHELRDRIADIIAVAQHLHKCNVPFPKSSKDYGYGDKDQYDTSPITFIADGINHYLGLDMRRCTNDRPYAPVRLMIKNGGCCGPWNLCVDKEGNVYGEYDGNSSTLTLYERATRDMTQFLRQFPVFESAFYKWVDSLSV